MNRWGRRVQERQLRGAARGIKVSSVAVVASAPSVVRSKQRPVKRSTQQRTVIPKLVELPNVHCSKIPKAPLTLSNLQKNYGHSKIPRGSSRPKVCLPVKTQKKAKVIEDKTKEVKRPRRQIEQIGSTPGSKKKAVTATIKQQPVPDVKRRSHTLKKGVEKTGVRDLILNKGRKSHVPTVPESEIKCKKRSPKQKRVNVDHRPTKEKTKPPVSTSVDALLNLGSMQHDMNAHEDKGRSNQQSRSDFIDQCLTFSKECDEATGRADRLLEELSLMRCQSRCSTKPAPPSWTTQRSISCHDMFKRGAMKLARKICLDSSSVRDKLTDSPMDASSSQHLENQKWRRSQSDRIERSSDKADRDASSIQEPAPGSGTWLQQLAKKPAKQLETPLHVELKICLDRLAKLELENRALRQLLLVKWGSSSDAGIEELLKMSMANQTSPLGPSMDISPRKLIGMVTMDSACDAKP